MKNYGTLRKVDCVGRISIPKEVRDALGIVENKTFLKILVKGESIVLEKYEPLCVICGKGEDIKIISDKKICMKCVEKISHHLTDQSKSDD